jgi:UV DNA damage endonuclease
MKIGYPCINRSIKCTSSSTFRLVNYSEKNLIQKIETNLECLKKMLFFNTENNILFLRIGSGLIPFASHEICSYDWKKHFTNELKEIGNYIKKNKIRISMHPDQFVVMNSKDKRIVGKSIKEIEYHCDVLDIMKLSSQAKVQIHIGGVYNQKEESIERFIKNYLKLSSKIKKRLVVENDHHSYSLKDCLYINKKTGIPVVFDTYHHQCLNNKESFKEAIKKAFFSWKRKDGLLMVDYSNGDPEKRIGSHAESIDVSAFSKFLKETEEFDFDIMMELKDKEKSALKGLKVMKLLKK